MKSTAARRYYRLWLNMFSAMAIALVVLGCGHEEKTEEKTQLTNTVIAPPLTTTAMPQSAAQPEEFSLEEK